MLEHGFITQEEFDAWKNEKVEFKAQVATGIRAPSRAAIFTARVDRKIK